MMSYAYDMSESLKLPVMMRTVTRLAHSRAVVDLKEEESSKCSYRKRIKRLVLLPANARRRYAAMIEKQPEIMRLSEESPFNSFKAEAKRFKMGAIACGNAFNYLNECYPDGVPFPVIKISQYPVPAETVRTMAEQCASILVIEDGQPFVEEQLKGILPTECSIIGRLTGDLPRMGELNPDIVKKAMGLSQLPHLEVADNIVSRPPALCLGCGQRSVYEAIIWY